MTAANPGSLVTLVRRGRRPACVMLPGSGGGLSPYLRLARHLGKTYNVYGVLPTGMLPGERPEDTIAEMTAAVGRALDNGGIRPEVVFGWSFGGIIAWELSCDLAATGARPRVVIVDSSPLPRRATAAEDHEIQSRILAQLGPLAKPDLIDRVLNIFAAQIVALREYEAERHYDGRVLLQMCTPWDTEATAAAVRRWKELAGDLTVGTLDADHYDVFEPPYLPQLVAAIDEFLGSAA
ncbi:alpha/beta fold hydrolase [Nocardia sp. CDC159]|uniref:Alpha/beta fold hydrolase n=1 Tax=Nocardia pulmonis TaxID=2951408 RepID=A0A9X2IYJ2_9NOCA|nr:MULTISPECIES: alpha/beta fold hydrolase [Nocardia]MCM6773981.1 alpha/beta fold hydrolase [Nocardia pulmonis]MCM6786868.1 alpha/beta fold hydrolase [Nocardia sp. CDC159]